MKTFNEQRNFDNVQFSDLRKKVDLAYNTLHDDLSDCYYNFWGKGLSKPFVVGDKSYDVQATSEESKTLFDKLHGLIFDEREIRFHEENLKQPINERIPEEKYRYEVDENNQQIDKLAKTNKKIADLKKEGIELAKPTLVHVDDI